MSRRRPRWIPAYAAALLAVALLALASAQSIVMQALDPAPFNGWPVCSAGADPGAAPMPIGKAAHQVCSLCAAASCPPLGSKEPLLRLPSEVAWAPWRPVPALGPRGPPSLTPKARGPPSSSLTA